MVYEWETKLLFGTVVGETVWSWNLLLGSLLDSWAVVSSRHWFCLFNWFINWSQKVYFVSCKYHKFTTTQNQRPISLLGMATLEITETGLVHPSQKRPLIRFTRMNMCSLVYIQSNLYKRTTETQTGNIINRYIIWFRHKKHMFSSSPYLGMNERSFTECFNVS